MAKKARGLGGKRCVRRTISITSQDESKLNRLSIATGLPPSTIASIIIENGLNAPGFLNWLMDTYNRDPQWKCTPIVETDEQGKKYVVLV